jgi:hypothetical protein
MIQSHVNAIPNRDKKILIWNFMEELVNKHQAALTTNYWPVFEIQSFESIRLPILEQTNQFILRTLHEYEDRKGFFQIQGESVSLTEKGLVNIKNLRHDWD